MSTHSLSRDALVVAICQYDFLNNDEKGDFDLNKIKQLRTLAEQAEQLAQLLETQGGFKVTRLQSTPDFKLDLKQRVNLPDLKQAIEKLLFPPAESPTQTALLFFAGHGLVETTCLGTEGFLATSEADDRSIYGFSLKQLRKLLCKSPVKQQIVFLESCYSGEFFTHFQTDNEHDYCFITSSRAHEEALADGLLVKALLETLDCQKRLEDYVTSERLINYLNKIEGTNSGGQRFVYRIHGESILLSGDGREMLKNVEPIVRSEPLPQKKQVVTIGNHATGNTIIVGDHNQIK